MTQCGVVAEQAQAGKTSKDSALPLLDKGWFNSGSDPRWRSPSGLGASPGGPLTAKSTLAFLFASLKHHIPGRIP